MESETLSAIKSVNYKRKQISIITAIQPLMYIAKIMALVPCSFSSSISSDPKFRLDSKQIYAIIFTVIVVILNVGGYYYRTTDGNQGSEETVEIVEIITAFCLMLLNITPAISLNFWNKQNYQSFLNRFVKIDSDLDKYGMIAKESKTDFLLVLILTQGLFFSLTVYDSYLTYNILDAFSYFQALLAYLQRYHMYIHYLNIYYFINSFRLRFKTLNFLITESFQMKNSSSSTYGHIKNINRMFLELCENVDLLNTLFGMSILLFIIYALASLLLFINYLIYHNASPSANIEYGNYFLVAMVLWSAVTLIMGVVLAKSANSATKEVYRTSMLGFKLSHKFQISGTFYEEKLKENLILLAQEAATTCPHFTAAGFFDVDYSMLFTVLNMITSYLVVLIQFHK